jgi:hypothetical protein
MRCQELILRNGYFTGLRCGRQAQPDSRWCWQHQPPPPLPLVDVLTPPESDCRDIGV